MKCESTDYEATLDEIVKRHQKLFSDYKKMNGEQKNAVRDWAKRFNLGQREFRFAKAQYISGAALKKVQDKKKSQIQGGAFVMEHVIPKTEYIVDSIINACKKNPAKANKEIENIIRNRMRICFITKEQDKGLGRKIPADLEKKILSGKTVPEKELFARYFESKNAKLKNDTIYKIKKVEFKDGRAHITTDKGFVI